MKLKIFTVTLLLVAVLLSVATPKAEARVNVSLNLGALFAPPVCETVFVERYPAYPMYCAPAYPCYAPAPVVYAMPRPVCYPVCCPRPVCYNSVGFSWHSFR